MRRAFALGMMCAAMLGGGGLGIPAARAMARTETEEERVARALQVAMQQHGGDVNRCFERALADTLDVSGKVELEVDVGDGGKVTRAVPHGDAPAAASPVLLACLSESAGSWTLAGVAAGSTVILPFAFEGQMAQFSIKAADAPERGPGANAKTKAKPGKPASGKPGAQAAFTVKLLVDQATMRADKASLLLLTVAPASRIAMHKHPGAELLYVMKGKARVLGPSGVTPEVVGEGAAVFIPAGFPHVIENMGRSASAELLDVFAPPGPERVFRDPGDVSARGAFEVIRDASQAKAPAGAHLTVVTADKAPAHATAGGKMKVKILLEPSVTGSDAAALSVAEFDPGAEIPRHSHDGSAEILYVLEGSGGELEIGSEKLPIGPDQAIHLPAGQPHAAHFKAGGEKTIAVQIYAPAGPEQRFKK